SNRANPATAGAMPRHGRFRRRRPKDKGRAKKPAALLQGSQFLFYALSVCDRSRVGAVWHESSIDNSFGGDLRIEAARYRIDSNCANRA
ncbi:MAG: hypothetical protein J0H65_12305, partial [Rhizobiales bacterium]|nr:hypothetical protein [Hyphomicrobiales bacterium]